MSASLSATLRFDHAAVPVSDARSAYELFANVLELPLLAAYEGDDWDGAPWLMMIFSLSGGGQIALCALHGAEYKRTATDLPHFALGVDDVEQLDRWRKRLRSAGFAVRDEDHGDQQSIYFEDRTGLTWEVATRAPAVQPDPQAHSMVADWIAAH
jgi:catechol 2,3-dioxygenase-like lactoylglutathione lyase family enzyme